MDIVIKKTDSEEESANKLKEFVSQQHYKTQIDDALIFGIIKDSKADPLVFQKEIRDEW